MSEYSVDNLQVIEANDFAELSAHWPVIDVRSPAEFEHGHVTGAHSLPLFTDAQRTEIGIAYKHQSRQVAMMKGLDFVGPRLAGLVEQATQIAGSGKALIHCWRGGLRSRSLAQILSMTGMEIRLLNGGYKAYRSLIRKDFERPQNIVVVSGLTGVGKTDVLNLLRNQGEQVIDLEGLANHRGSVFGGIGQPAQPSTEQFENDLFHQVQHFDPAKTVWIEDEGNRLGRVVVPDAICQHIRHAPAINLNSNFENRAERLKRDYADLPAEELIVSIEKIRKRLGGLAVKQAITAVKQGQMDQVIRVVLAYYDKAYQTAMSTMPRSRTTDLNIDSLSNSQIVSTMLEMADTLYSTTSPS